MNYTHILYIKKYSIFTNKYELYICQTNSKDILHTIGEIYYRTIEAIERINYTKWTEDGIEYLKEQGYDILDWQDKYKIGEL